MIRSRAAVMPSEEKRGVTIATWCAWALGPGFLLSLILIALVGGRLGMMDEPSVFALGFFLIPFLVGGHIASFVLCIAILIGYWERGVPLEIWLLVAYYVLFGLLEANLVAGWAFVAVLGLTVAFPVLAVLRVVLRRRRAATGNVTV